jgi:hypothetical protein
MVVLFHDVIPGRAKPEPGISSRTFGDLAPQLLDSGFTLRVPRNDGEEA